MKNAALFLAVAALGNVVYHLGQKTISPRANPMVLLMVVYAVAFALAAAAAPFFRAAPGAAGLGEVLRWPVLVLAAGVVLIELGFLLAYRAGPMMQWSGVAVNGASALVLVPIALLAFGEGFSAARLAGIALILGGLALVSRG